MTRTVDHSSFEVEHLYRFKPEQVFKAWSDPKALSTWGSPGEGWRSNLKAFEFKVGGEQVTEFGPEGGPTFVNQSRYCDIVPNTRIVMAGSLSQGDIVQFVGVLTVTFASDGTGCRLRLTEQGVFLDGHDVPDNHRAGWESMLQRLEADWLAHAATDA